MPTWTTNPPNPDDHLAHRIIRCPADAPLHAIATSTSVVGCNTHYANHRTTPCEAPAPCELCQAGHSTRWHGYLAVLVPATMEHALLEITAAAWQTLHAYLTQHDTLRGCGLVLSRPSKRPNGRVLVRCQPVDHRKWQLPPPPNTIRVLCHIWGIPYDDAMTIAPAYGAEQNVAIPINQGDGRNGRRRLEPNTRPLT